MKIIFIDTTHPKLIEDLKCEGFICDQVYDKSKSEILKIIKNYDGLVIRSRFKIDQTFINAAKNLKFIARAGSGTENIDVHYANKKNIKCFNAAEGNRQAVAEHALGMILNLLNNIRVSDQEIRTGIWNREKNRGFELSGKTIGIIGFGNTGSSFAKILENFNVKILVYDKYKKNYKFKSNLDEILEFSDIISLHIPLTEETKQLIIEEVNAVINNDPRVRPEEVTLDEYENGLQVQIVLRYVIDNQVENLLVRFDRPDNAAI